MVRSTTAYAALLLAAILGIIYCLAACGGGGSIQPELSPALDSAPGSEHPSVLAPGGRDLGQVCAEILTTEAPATVSPAIWNELTGELVRILELRRISKVASTPPIGEHNRITDIAITDGTTSPYQLEWSYLNTGDYDLNGEVNASDITPIALFYSAYEGGPGWDEAQAADGDGNGEVNLADIQPIAVNYQYNVVAYRVAAIADPGGTEELTLGTMDLADSQPGVPPAFSWPLDSIDHALYRVYPVDGFGVEGLPSVDVVTAGDISISGEVIWDTGGPVEGATVGVSTTGQPVPVNTATDAAGDFSTMLTARPLPGQVMVRAVYADSATGLELTNYVWTEEQTGPGEVTDISIILPNPAGRELTVAGSSAQKPDGSIRVNSLAPEVERVFAQVYDPELAPEIFPGDYEDNEGIEIDSQVFVWISSLDGAGQMVDNLSAPADVRIEIPLSQYPELADVTLGNGQIDVPIYDFAYGTGEWEYRGTGYLVDAADAVLSEDLEGDILSGVFTDPLWAVFEADHFSWWNCDRPYAGGLDFADVPDEKRQALGEGAQKAWDMIVSKRGNDAFKKWNKPENPDLKDEIGKNNGSGSYSPRDGGVRIRYKQYKDKNGNPNAGIDAWYSGRKRTFSIWNWEWQTVVNESTKMTINVNSDAIEAKLPMTGNATEYQRRARKFWLGICLAHEIVHMKSLVYGGNLNITAAASSGINCEGYQWEKEMFKGLIRLKNDGQLQIRSNEATNPDFNKWKDITLDDLKNKYCNSDSDLYKGGSSLDIRQPSEVGFSGLELTLSTAQTQYGLVDPVVVEVKFSNTSVEDMVVPEIVDTYLNPLIFYIEDEKGNLMPWLEPILFISDNPDTEVTIPAGGDYSAEFILRYYDTEDELRNYGILAAGDYDIYAYYNEGLPPWDGVTSNTITINVDVDLPPEIRGIWPVSGLPGTDRTFSVSTAFAYVDSWAWDFGGGATPDTSTEESPTVTFGSEGLYDASVTATNAAGTDVYNFQLLVADIPPAQMFGGDSAHSRQSLVEGAQTNHIDWCYDKLTGNSAVLTSSPAVDIDGTIYIGSSGTSLRALNPDGTEKWSYDTGSNVQSTPAIALDGTVYFGSGNANVYALNPDGSEKWIHPTGASIGSSPVIAPDGTVYIGSKDHYLYAISPDNTLLWRFDAGNEIQSSPALAPDGTVYIGSDTNRLYAVNPDGTLKWEYNVGDDVIPSPTVGPDGTIYITCDYQVTAINSDGTLKWKYDDIEHITSSPALATDGTLYVGSSRVAQEARFYAFDTDGYVKWSVDFGNNFRGSPTIGAEGTVYIGTYYDDDWPAMFYALDPDGNVLWSYPTDYGIESSAAIDSDGRVIVADTHKLYVFSGTVPEAEVAPEITGVTPLTGRPGSQPVFWASTYYDNVNGWSWDFGGAATPDTSSDLAPVVTLTAVEGVYDVSVTASNSAGSDVYNFQIDVGQFPQWQFYGHDPARSGRSTFTGPQTSGEAWVYDSGSNNGGGPTIAADGTVYVGGGFYWIYGIAPDATLLHSYETGYYSVAGPAISDDGTEIYTTSRDGFLYAFDSSLGLNWSIEVLPGYESLRSHPVIARNGLIYCGGEEFNAFSTDGSLNWSLPWRCREYSAAVAPDGTIYIWTQKTSSDIGRSGMQAIRPDGVLKWSITNPSTQTRCPAIGPGGTLYCNGSLDSTGGLLAVSPNGVPKWVYPASTLNRRSPAVAADGTVIFATSTTDDNLFALNPDGTERWSFGIPASNGSPVVDAEGSVYIGGGNGFFYAINPDGSLKWTYEALDSIDTSPAISEDGYVYFGDDDAKLYRIGP